VVELSRVEKRRSLNVRDRFQESALPIETPFFKAVVGKTVSHLWRGHGSALFVELAGLG